MVLSPNNIDKKLEFYMIVFINNKNSKKLIIYQLVKIIDFELVI